jgi:hypothetical protein
VLLVVPVPEPVVVEVVPVVDVPVPDVVEVWLLVLVPVPVDVGPPSAAPGLLELHASAAIPSPKEVTAPSTHVNFADFITLCLSMGAQNRALNRSTVDAANSHAARRKSIGGP